MCLPNHRKCGPKLYELVLTVAHKAEASHTNSIHLFELLSGGRKTYIDHEVVVLFNPCFVIYCFGCVIIAVSCCSYAGQKFMLFFVIF